jgi:transcriptional regulator with GAF, ATPase, and Fis domain
LIHLHSRRNDRPFVAVHCGAIPETLLESELFGHEKGAFTGAVRKKIGKFEMARGGTIFLDEIGTVTAAAQIKLLQVLQDGSFSRVGGEEELKTDARVISATNADLKALAETGHFRKDLYFRLNIFPIDIPPLRERMEDIPFLIDVLLDRLNTKYGKAITRIHPNVIEGFKYYDWQGNIRELENVIERAYILETTDMLCPQFFPPEMVAAVSKPPQEAPRDADLTLAQARQRAIQVFECDYFKNLLKLNRGKINLSAQKAGITERQLSRLLRRYGIDKKDFKQV